MTAPTPEGLPASPFDFGSALRALKAGHRVARAGWNGKGMWIALQKPEQYPSRPDAMTHWFLFIEYPVGHVAYPEGSRVPWLASQTDMLAEDWSIAH